VKWRGVGGFDEGKRGLEPHPDDGMNPFFGLIRRQADVGPQFVPASSGKVGTEGVF